MWDVAREAWEEVWEQVASSCCCRRLGGVDDHDNDVRGDEQDIMYVDGGSLSRNRHLAEGGEGAVDNYRCVRGLHRWIPGTGDGESRSPPVEITSTFIPSRCQDVH